jgi:hypothetical protein
LSLSNVNLLFMWQKNKELGVVPIIMDLHMHDLLLIIRNYIYYYYTLIIVATLALGLRPRQGFATVWAKREVQESHFMLPGV